MRYDFDGNLVEEITYDNSYVVTHNKVKDWQMDGVIRYEWPSTPKVLRLKEIPGVYIWEKGELSFLRSFEDEEIESGNPSLELNKKAKKVFYDKK